MEADVRSQLHLARSAIAPGRHNSGYSLLVLKDLTITNKDWNSLIYVNSFEFPQSSVDFIMILEAYGERSRKKKKRLPGMVTGGYKDWALTALRATGRFGRSSARSCLPKTRKPFSSHTPRDLSKKLPIS